MSMKKWALAKEEDGAVGEVAVVVADAEQTCDAVEEAHEEIASLGDAIDEAVEAHEDLGIVTEVAQESLASGGMDAFAARLAHRVLDKVSAKLGQAAPTFSKESYSSTRTRSASTTYTQESVKEKAKKVWETIAQFFANLLRMVVDFVNKVLGRGAEALKKRAKALVEAAGKKSTKHTAEESEFDYHAINTVATSKGSDVTHIANATKSLAGATAVIKGGTEMMVKMVAATTLEELLRLEEEAADKYDNAIGELPGGWTVKKDDDEKTAKLERNDPEAKSEVKLPSVKEIKTLAEDVGAVADAAKKADDLVKSVEKSLKEVIEHVNKAKNALGDTATDDQKSDAKVALAKAKAARTTIVEVMIGLSKLQISGGNAVLGYAEAALRQYKKED